MPYEDFHQQLTSSSHLTVSQNIELRNLLNECNRMRCNGNLSGWRWKQDAIKAELSFDLNRLDKDSEDKNGFAARIKAVEDKISIEAIKKPKSPAELAKQRDLMYKLLDEREVILRELQEKSGKGTKRTFDDSDDDE